MGDAHLAQGDGELDGTAIETSITGKVTSALLFLPTDALPLLSSSQCPPLSVLCLHFYITYHLSLSQVHAIQAAKSIWLSRKVG